MQFNYFLLFILSILLLLSNIKYISLHRFRNTSAHESPAATVIRRAYTQRHSISRTRRQPAMCHREPRELQGQCHFKFSSAFPLQIIYFNIKSMSHSSCIVIHILINELVLVLNYSLFCPSFKISHLFYSFNLYEKWKQEELLLLLFKVFRYFSH